MKNNDMTERKTELQQKLQQAIKDNDGAAFSKALGEMMEEVAQEIRQDYEDLRDERDSRVLAQRDIRQLTSEEKAFYQRLGEAAKAADPRQALANASVVMPETVIQSVFDELETRHPILSRIDFTATGGLYKLIMSTNAEQQAAWGELCDEIVKELTAGFVEVDGSLCKISAFLPVCKAMLDLGPEWLDQYVRQVLYEALANGLESAFVDGDGNKKPIGMTRQVGAGVTVSGGVYPKKAATKVTSLDPKTVGAMVSQLAVDDSGKPRQIRDLVLIVKPQDYFQRVMPATTVMAPDGTYRNNVLPYPMEVIQSAALERGEAVLGLAYRYFGAAGTDLAGRIEYSDHARFLQDQRVYIIKAYANGMPKDNKAFMRLDISDLAPLAYKVEVQDARTKGNDATLAALNIGGLALSPAFAAGTVTYTADTTNASDAISALPADAAASIKVTVGGKEINNGAAATWATGANTVKVAVTAEDGTTSKTYTVTVTKS